MLIYIYIFRALKYDCFFFLSTRTTQPSIESALLYKPKDLFGLARSEAGYVLEASLPPRMYRDFFQVYSYLCNQSAQDPLAQIETLFFRQGILSCYCCAYVSIFSKKQY